MKNNTTTLHDELKLNNARAGSKEAMGQGWKLGLDVDLRCIVVAMQDGRGRIGAARKFLRAQLIAWVKERTAAGQAVFTVYECCGFGYTLHEELVAAGAHSIVTTPMRLNLERRRKTIGWTRGSWVCGCPAIWMGMARS
jgi:hypothetical protein